MKITKQFALALLACLPVFGAGTVGVSISPLGNQNPPGGQPENRVHVITITWVGDSVNGTVPSTVININQFPQLSGYRLISIEIQPGTPSPSTNYSITVIDAAGVDILAGNGANLSATVASYTGSLLSPPLIASPTFNLSGNSIASAKGTISLYFAPLSQVAAARGLPATLPATQSFTGSNTFGNGSVFTPFTFSNHNNIFWAGPGPTPTIDQGVTQCAALTLPCIVEISPGYTGPESTSLFTTSLGYVVFNGANNVTVMDHRQLDFGVANQTQTKLYGMMFGGRNAGALNRVAVNYYAHNPSDSSTGTNGFNWIDGTLPSNNGAQYGSISFATTHDTLTIGSSTSVIAASDHEAYNNATTVDKDLPYITGLTAASGMSRANATGNILTASAVFGNPCQNVSSTGKIENCYTFDATKPTLGVAANYSYHGYGSFLTEALATYDFVDNGFNINAASEASSTVTITTSATCNFLTGQKVRITGVGTTSFGYNGIWTVLTPGCNGGSTFTYTNTATGLATLGVGGHVAGIYSFLAPDSFGNAVQTSRAFSFRTPEGVTRASVGSNGLLGQGTVGATSSGGAFLGGGGSEFAGLYLLETGAPSGLASDTVCGAVTTTHTLQCSYNNGTPFSMTQTIGSGTAALTTAAIAAGNCGTTVTVAAAGVTTTDTITWAFNAAPAGSNAGLVAWPTSGNVNFAYCPNSAETPAAATANWRVVR